MNAHQVAGSSKISFNVSSGADPALNLTGAKLLNHHWVIGSTHTISYYNFQMLWPVKIFSSKESKNYFLLGIVNDIPKVSVNL